MMKDVTFITGNAAKAEQLSKHLHFPVEHIKLDLPEIQSLDPHEIVKYKAREAFKRIRKPVIVEDTSLVFNSLGRLPGPLIKWFLEELGNEGLCRLLHGYDDRSAVAHVNFAFCRGEDVMIFDAQANGTVTYEPKGMKGFGWDPIFIPDGYIKTYGEMTFEERDIVSIRKIATEKLAVYIAKFETSKN